jgi:hypothetical protein
MHVTYQRLACDKKKILRVNSQWPFLALKYGIKTAGNVDLSEAEQIRILQEYELECEAAARVSGEMPIMPDHYSPPGKDQLKPTDIKTREKRDMVIVGEGPSNSSSGQTSVADKGTIPVLQSAGIALIYFVCREH